MGPFFLIALSSPKAWQLVQRTATVGTITIAGGASGAIEASYAGADWATLGTFSGTFSGELESQAQGQGTLSVRILNDDTNKVSVANLGIGDIFIVAGQSNALGQATNAQSYSHATLHATKFTRAGAWADCTDKVDSASGAAGSWMPPLATLFMADQGVPCAFVPAGVDASRIADWATGGTNYNALLARITAAGGAAKCILWWQGEGDAMDGTLKATYKAALNTLANDLFTATGLKLVAAKLQACTGANVTTINEAITECWAENDNILAGADLSDITTDDDFHLKTDAKQALAAERWWTALAAEFYP